MVNRDNNRRASEMDRYGREGARGASERNVQGGGCTSCALGRGGNNVRGTRGSARNSGCGCGCGGGGEDREADRRMRRLQQLDFAIQEVVLYLDSYPGCRRALDRYHRLLCERARAAAECAEVNGPLTAWSNENTDAWDWVGNPWPWQSDFPGNKNG